MVVGAVEEECPTSKGARHIAAYHRPQMCIIGEPSNWDRITLSYKGRLVLHWRWQGGLGHSAGQTVTPAERAVAYWGQVQSYVEQCNTGKTRLFEWLDTALQDLNTGADGIDGWAQMTIGFRLPEDADPQKLADALRALPEGESATLQFTGMEHAYVAPKDTALSRAFRAAIRAQGGTPAFVQKTGTSDMNVVGHLWGGEVPMVAYGPGDSALDHTPDEHLDLDEYARAIRVLQTVLESL
jgi:LysW-gamma-L-lysine carboxypeptidase